MTQIKSDFMAKTFENVLTQEETNSFINYCNNTNRWREIPNNFWDKRTIHYSVVKNDNPILGEVLEKTIKIIQKKMIEEYKLSDIPYPDTLDVVRWFPGMEQQPHCDDMSDNEHQHQHFSHRYFGCVIYLNDNYTGGKTYYPEHNITISPKPGMAAIHLGDCNHRHGVTKVENNVRYTIASFWGFDKNRAIREITWE